MLKGLVLVLLNQYNPFVHQWLKKITSHFLFTHGQELCTKYSPTSCVLRVNSVKRWCAFQTYVLIIQLLHFFQAHSISEIPIIKSLSNLNTEMTPASLSD